MWDLLVHPTDQVLVSSSSDGTVKLWNSTSAALTHTFREIPSPTCLTWTNNFDTICSATSDGRLVFVDLASSSVTSNVQIHSSSITSLSSHDGLISAACCDGQVFIYDVKTGKSVASFKGHDDAVTGLVFQDSFVSCGLDSRIRWWDVKKWGCEHEFSRHDGGVWDIGIIRDGSLVASAGDDAVVNLFEM